MFAWLTCAYCSRLFRSAACAPCLLRQSRLPRNLSCACALVLGCTSSQCIICGPQARCEWHAKDLPSHAHPSIAAAGGSSPVMRALTAAGLAAPAHGQAPAGSRFPCRARRRRTHRRQWPRGARTSHARFPAAAADGRQGAWRA